MTTITKAQFCPDNTSPINPLMNTYIFVLSTSVLSIAAFSYHQALEILVQAVGIDAAADYLFSEINLSVNN